MHNTCQPASYGPRPGPPVNPSLPERISLNRADHILTLAERLKLVIARSGLSVGDLAAEAGVHKCTLMRVAKGTRGMQTATLAAICRVIGCTSDYLLGLSDESGIRVGPNFLPPGRTPEDGWLP